MDIRMKQVESLHLASTMKDAETANSEKTADTVKTTGVSEAEKVTKAVQLDRTTGMTDVSKTGKDAALRKPAYDRYIPEKQESSASFGHYQPVSDGKGGMEIQFDPPKEEAAPGDAPSAPVKDKPADIPAAEDTAKDGEMTGETAQKQSVPEDRESGEKKARQADAGQLTEGQTKVQKLKTKKKQLEQQIKSAVDPNDAEKLKRKLAQVKRELSAAGK